MSAPNRFKTRLPWRSSFRFVRHLPASHTHATMRQDAGRVLNKPKRLRSLGIESRPRSTCYIAVTQFLQIAGIESQQPEVLQTLLAYVWRGHGVSVRLP